jgi:hypothetical protein
MADLIECLTLRLTPLLSQVMQPLMRLLLVLVMSMCAGDKEIQESIFVDEGLQGINGDEDEPLPPSTSSPEHVPAFTLEAETPQATTSSTAADEVSWVEGEIISELGAPSHIQKAPLPQQIIGNLNERVTWSLRSAHLSCFTNMLFVAVF